jgi:hypothetical protein
MKPPSEGPILPGNLPGKSTKWPQKAGISPGWLICRGSRTYALELNFPEIH